MWQPIGTAPINTYILARLIRDGQRYLPAVVMYDTRYNRWITPGEVMEDSRELLDPYSFYFPEEWQPTEWHSIPANNEAEDGDAANLEDVRRVVAPWIPSGQGVQISSQEYANWESPVLAAPSGGNSTGW